MSIKLKGSSDGSVSFDAPADTSPSGSDITLTLPTSAGSANQFLKNSGTAGTLEYSSMVEDSSGRLMVGHSSSRDVANVAQPKIQIEGTNVSTSTLSVVRNSNDAAGPVLALSKTRGTSTGSSTVVQSGDTAGSIYFSGADGTDVNSYAAWIEAEIDGTPGGNDMPGRLVFSTTADGANSPTERMRLDSGGRLGIGATPNSQEQFLVHGGGSSIYVPFARSSTRWISLHSGGTDPGIFTNDGANLRFGHGSARNNFSGEKMRLASGGALRIGGDLTANAAGKFQVVEEGGGNQANDCNAYFETNAQDWNIKTYYNRSGTHYHIVFLEQGTERGSIRGNDGSNVTFNQGSDYRWKENIVEMTGTEGIEICKRLKPSKYNWIENREQTGEINTVDGFIAHEVVEAGVLGAVVGEKDAVNEDGSIKGQLLDYGQMTPVLSAGIKGLIAKVETLETQNTAQQAQIDDLLARVTALEAA